ncbi:hypothetical protein [Dechloromonas sp. A34]|nr:hypothetical protein [Dechloromonas sp. A34]
MWVTSRANATHSDGKAIDDHAQAVIGMIFRNSTAGLVARRTSPR